MTLADCSQARQWLSAFRDGDVLPDEWARRHVDSCRACRAWEESLDQLGRRFAVRETVSRDVVSAAVRAWDGRAGRSYVIQRRVGRALLTLAGVAGVALALATAGGAIGSTGGHTVRDLVAMECAVAVGFLLAAWRPARYGRGLLAVAAVAGTLTVADSAGTVATAPAAMVAELSHIPVLMGVLALFVLLDAINATSPGHARRT